MFEGHLGGGSGIMIRAYFRQFRSFRGLVLKHAFIGFAKMESPVSCKGTYFFQGPSYSSEIRQAEI